MALRHEKRVLQKSEIALGREGVSQAVNFPEVRNEIVALKKLEQEQKEVAAPDRDDRGRRPQDRVAAGSERERTKCGAGETGGGKETDPSAPAECQGRRRSLRSRAGRGRAPAPGKRCGRPRSVEKAGRIAGANAAARRPGNANGRDQRAPSPFAGRKSGSHARPDGRSRRLPRRPGKTDGSGSRRRGDRQTDREDSRRIRSARSSPERAEPRPAGGVEGSARPSSDRRRKKEPGLPEHRPPPRLAGNRPAERAAPAGRRAKASRPPSSAIPSTRPSWPFFPARSTSRSCGSFISRSFPSSS